jgi:ribonuclease-3 family protein
VIGLSGKTLAYLGDSVYELSIRYYLIGSGMVSPNNLDKNAKKWTSAEGQTKAYELFKSELSEEELTYFKKGRNASNKRKSPAFDQSTYQTATGIESLFGYLYLTKQHERIGTLISKIFQV